MNWRDIMFIALFLLSVGTFYNAKEAHTHSHDAACAAGHKSTCKYVR